MDTWLRLYGVGCVVILLSVSAGNFGLRFMYVLAQSTCVLVYYCVAGAVFNDEFPQVVVFMVVVNIMYVHSSYSRYVLSLVTHHLLWAGGSKHHV
jgi:hypothetical protein